MTDEEFERSRFAAALLHKYNPTLVMFPQNRRRERPGRYSQGENGRGDYHPCSAEFFLSQVSVYLERRSSKKDDSAYAGNGIPALWHALRFAPDRVRETANWEIDLHAFERNNATQAWWAYHHARDEYQGRNEFFPPVVAYGRVKRKSDLIALQYWYLSYYNDSANKHEGDWECVTILLRQRPDDAEPEPFYAGFAGHAGGVKRPWRGVSRRETHPLVYVAKGSHAAYLDHLSFGYHVASISYRKDVKGNKSIKARLYDLVFGVPSRLFFFLGVRDYTTPLDSYDERMVGELVTPELRVFPAQWPSRDDPLSSPHWWWLLLDCPWGSSRPAHGPLASEFLAPDPPWKKDLIWHDPVTWVIRQRTR
jgi:hypothetical protein